MNNMKDLRFILAIVVMVFAVLGMVGIVETERIVPICLTGAAIIAVLNARVRFQQGKKKDGISLMVSGILVMIFVVVGLFL